MKQADDPSRLAINRRQVAALVTIANRAGPAKILRLGQATMLAGNDVVRLMWFPGIVLVQQAILASEASAVLHQRTQSARNLIAHDATGRRLRRRALIDWISASRCSN
jgi:hypothetical protein